MCHFQLFIYFEVEKKLGIFLILILIEIVFNIIVETFNCKRKLKIPVYLF
jgi:hypothetical protein